MTASWCWWERGTTSWLSRCENGNYATRPSVIYWMILFSFAQPMPPLTSAASISTPIAGCTHNTRAAAAAAEL